MPHPRRRPFPVLAALTCVVAATPVAAGESVYTPLKRDDCRVIELNDEEGWGVWECEGYNGIPVRYAEGDLRTLVSYGATASREKASEQTLAGFNRVHDTLEWRLRPNKHGTFVPVATILRFFVQQGDTLGAKEAEVLVVTQLGEGRTCHIAYIDALANRNANELARKAADDLAGRVDCADPPRVIGVITEAVQ